MSDLDHIRFMLRQTAGRLRRVEAWRRLTQGLLAGSLIWVIGLSAYKLAPIPPSVVAGAAWIGLLVPLVAAVCGWWRRPTLLETARWMDDRRHLKERLSTALEVAESSGPPGWSDLVVRDAARHLEDIRPRQLLPYQFSVVMRWTCLVLLLGIGLGWVPEYRTETHRKAEEEAARIQEVGKRLAEAVRHPMESRPAHFPQTTQSIEEIEALADFMSKAKLTRGEAIKELAQVQNALKDQIQTMGDALGIKTLEKAARPPGAGSGERDSLRNQIQTLEEELGQASRNPDKLEDLLRSLQELQRSAQNLPQDGSPDATAARDSLAQALAGLSRQASDLGVALPGLEQAIAALRNQQTDLMLRDLQFAADDLSKLQQMAQSMQTLQEQIERLGRDLAEQLQQGQIAAARQTLEKMMRDLKNSGLSQEQLSQLKEELGNAIDPAGQYGAVGEKLSAALNALDQGGKDQASQHLAEAARELEQLQQQLADSQSLMAAMDALSRAQQAIATGKGWENSQTGYCATCGGAGCAACRSQIGRGWAQGGRAGAGVGTWAEEGWAYQPMSQQPVDNSGVRRPDLDPRGNTDRPRDLNPDLAPTKLRGQMSPGQSMPSITLKGVHIRGQSTVQFEEAAAAAQAEVEQALNQDQVPRMHRNTVRNYFDDLRE